MKGLQGGQYKPLSDADIHTLHEAALTLLEKTGFTYESGLEDTVDMLAAAGARVDRAAARIRFPRALTLPKDQADHAYDFSFSGLKTAVARWVEARRDAGEEIPLHDVAASFAAAVADVLTAKTIRACQLYGVDTLVIGGGFSANSQLRDMAAERCAAAGIELRIPPIRYCTDNGAMIAALGSALVRAGVGPSSLDIPVDSSMPLTITHV